MTDQGLAMVKATFFMQQFLALCSLPKNVSPADHNHNYFKGHQ